MVAWPFSRATRQPKPTITAESFFALGVADREFSRRLGGALLHKLRWSLGSERRGPSEVRGVGTQLRGQTRECVGFAAGAPLIALLAMSGIPLRRHAVLLPQRMASPFSAGAVMLATDHTVSACRSIVRGWCPAHRRASAPCRPKCLRCHSGCATGRPESRQGAWPCLSPTSCPNTLAKPFPDVADCACA